ncbi:MAG TPA: hypothetical protein VGD65_02265 [Chryseosolibacter sp.]
MAGTVFSSSIVSRLGDDALSMRGLYPLSSSIVSRLGDDALSMRGPYRLVVTTLDRSTGFTSCFHRSTCIVPETGDDARRLHLLQSPYSFLTIHWLNM